MAHQTDAREIGVVKSVNEEHGYGFVRRTAPRIGERVPDLFIHASECNNEFDNLKPGTRIEFSVGKDRSGRDEAKNVAIVPK